MAKGAQDKPSALGQSPAPYTCIYIRIYTLKVFSHNYKRINIYTYIYIYMYTYKRKYISEHIFYIYIYIYIFFFLLFHIFKFIHIYTYIYIDIYTYGYIKVYIYVYMLEYLYLTTYIQNHSWHTHVPGTLESTQQFNHHRGHPTPRITVYTHPTAPNKAIRGHGEYIHTGKTINQPCI